MGVFIGAIPNSTDEDIQLARDILSKKVSIRNARNKLATKFKAMFDDKDIFLFNRGREAMHFLFKNISLNEGDEVIVQAFTCIAVIAPILWSKAKPVYVDIGRETFNIDTKKLKEAITEKTKVVIIQHTFGNLVDTKKIREIINEENEKRSDDRKIYLLEDYAHIFDSNIQDLGKYSDAFFFSFAQDKAVSCTQGSLLVLNKGYKLAGDLHEEYKKVEELTGKEALYNAKYIYLWARIKKYYFTLDIPLLRLSVGKILLLLYRFLGMIRKQASSDSVELGGMYKLSDVQAKLLDEQLGRIEGINIHRRNIARIYTEGLKEGFKFNAEDTAPTSSLLRYPVLLQNPNKVREELRKSRVIVGRWYTTPIFPIEIEKLGGLQYVIGSCTEAEFCCRNIINLPTNIEVTEDIARNIVWVINSVGKEI